jgi:stage II sporulation protein P
VEGEPICISTESGVDMAPVMLLIGNGNGFDVKPWYEQNLCFARALEARINKACPGLCKPVLVKDGRYNQHVGVFSMLLEVGHNQNTLSQACNSVIPVANAIHSLMSEAPDQQVVNIKKKWDSEHREAA